MDQNERQTFFIQVPVGLEKLAKKELELKFPGLFPNLPLPHQDVELGGLTLELPLKVGLALNYWLKTPNKILLRFAHFKCRDIPKLFNKVSKLPWSPFYAGQECQIDVSSNNSRLFDDRKIKKAITDALAKFTKAQEPKAQARQRVKSYEAWKILVRFEEDWCTISLDTSGERLGLRGYKDRVGIAPLRENLASALYFFTALSFTEEAQSFTRALTLVDPFCGSGTILLEASLFFEPNLFRNYAFEFFPKADQFHVLRPTSFRLERDLFLLGSDISEERIEDTTLNFKEAGLLTINHHLQVGDLTQGNFRKRLSEEIFRGEKKVLPWLLTNPPYGKRIKRPFTPMEFLKELRTWGEFERVGLLLPREQLAGLTLPDNIKEVAHLDFVHGGDKVRFALYSFAHSLTP